MTRSEGAEGPLLTKVEAISLAQREGCPLSTPAFDGFLMSGQAPPPHTRIAGEPVWLASAILEWSDTRLQELQSTEADRLLHQLLRDEAPGKTPRLSVASLDDDVPTHVAVLRAERRLKDMLSMLEMERDRLKNLIDQKADVDTQKLPLRRGTFSAAQDAWWRRRLEEVETEKRLIATDQRACAAWVFQLLGWCQSELPKRRQVALEDAGVEAEREARTLEAFAVEHFGHMRQYLDGDPRRGGAGEQLSRADFGVSWRLDATDRGVGWDSHGGGTWRVSWIPGNGELYAYERVTSKVILFGQLPTAQLDPVTSWLRPIQGRERERNSLVLVADAFSAQQRTGFARFLSP
jgi:hypothetical protein